MIAYTENALHSGTQRKIFQHTLIHKTYTDRNYTVCIRKCCKIYTQSVI